MRHFHQVGRGTYFIGNRYQKGNGFFGRMLRSAIYPLLKYIGSKGIKTAVAIGREAVLDPNTDMKTIAKRKLAETGLEVMEDGVKKVKEYAQSGNGVKASEGIKGVKKRRKRTTKKKKPTSRKTKKKPSKTKKGKTKRTTKKVSKPQKKKRSKAHLFLKKNGSASV